MRLHASPLRGPHASQSFWKKGKPGLRAAEEGGGEGNKRENTKRGEMVGQTPAMIERRRKVLKKSGTKTRGGL